MNRTLRTTTSIAITAAALLTTGTSFAGVERVAHPVDGQFIVVLRHDAVRPAAADPFDRRPDLAELSHGMASDHRGKVGRQYGHALLGFTFEGDAADAEQLASDPRVAYVSQDGWITVSGQQAAPSWGLDRIDQRPTALDGMYDYHADGAGIDVFVIDTGIRSTHQDFGGRVELGRSFSAVADGNGTEDCNGHGTHVAGIIGSATYGVAKGVTLHPVRVLDCTGWGRLSDVAAGVDWVTSLYQAATTTSGGKRGGGKRQTSTAPAATGAVVNMSLEAPWSSVIDDAVTSSIAAGITYVVAAGNNQDDACRYSPARLPATITVGASEGNGGAAAYSNTGACVDLFAPGSSIVSTFAGNDTDSLTMSGTSMAAPHVTGSVALLLSINPNLSPADVETIVRAAATPDELANVAAGTPNRLLYVPFTGWDVDMPPVAQFTYSCSNGTCTFDATSSADDRGVIDYAWDFGNGHTGSGATVSAKYGRRGPSQATVTLDVTDTTGQISTMQLVVRTGL